MLLKLFTKNAKKCNNTIKLHCLIKPILIEVSTSEKRPKNVTVEVRGQESKS